MKRKNVSACRFCQSPLENTFVDLGMSPLCQDHIKPEELKKMEPFYPLHAYVCTTCFLVQLEEFVPPSEIFNDYAYFSSYSDSYLAHARRYAYDMTKRFSLTQKSFVAEVASNDGYLLQYFNEQNIPVLGIEPAANVAKHAIQNGINTTIAFFGARTAKQLSTTYEKADLLIGNNVLAHVPDINDFVKGLKIFLNQEGVITMEFPHLLRLVENNQFDTIYHEHFSYLSLLTVNKIFKHHGLIIFDVDEIATHGGSLRIYARHAEDNTRRQRSLEDVVIFRQIFRSGIRERRLSGKYFFATEQRENVQCASHRLLYRLPRAHRRNANPGRTRIVRQFMSFTSCGDRVRKHISRYRAKPAKCCESLFKCCATLHQVAN